MMGVYLSMGVYFLRCLKCVAVHLSMGIYASRVFNQANTVSDTSVQVVWNKYKK